MSRTGLDAETLARSLRARAGDGSIEWDCEPIQTSVLLDVADMLAENAKLRESVNRLMTQRDERLARAEADNAKLREEIEAAKHDLQVFSMGSVQLEADNAKLRELLDYVTPIAWYAASERERDRMRELGVDA